ncbi:MAG: Glu-tRNA(Gln) amidotransferase subunit GatD [Sulfolobales archaeon]
MTVKDLKPGDLVRIIKDGQVIEGILMPSTELSSKDGVVIVKLANGYNVGISIIGAHIEVIKENYARVEVPEGGGITTYVEGQGGKLISIVSTGGTIVSKVEYETGAVRPALIADDLIDFVPEIREMGSIEVVDLYRLLSENMTPDHWTSIAKAVWGKLVGGSDGVIVTHGTDTLSYTSSALAFALRNLPMPVVLVGSQRSSDRPSSDSALNLLASAIIALNAPFGEVVVAMHGSISDTYILACRGVKVRKMHSSRRDAFQPVNDIPLAKVVFPDRKLVMISSKYLSRCRREDLILMPNFERKVAIVKAYPGLDPEIIDFLVDRGFKGIVLEGTGLGHVNEACIPSVRRAVEEGVVVVMATQTIFGRVNMNVYTTGRKLLMAGVLPASDMLAETAYVKLSWLLANFNDLSEVKKLFVKNIVYEINEVHEDYIYPRWYHGDRLQ